LKFFLIQIGPAVPLMLGPHVGIEGGWEGVETHRNSRLRVVSAKIELFFTPTLFLLARHTQSPLDDRRAQAHPAYFRFDCWRWPVGLARRERPPKSSSSHPSTGVGARAVSIWPTASSPRTSPTSSPRLPAAMGTGPWGSGAYSRSPVSLPIASSAPPMAMDAASRLLDAGFPVYLAVAPHRGFW